MSEDAVETRRLAIEIMATLANLKSNMAEFILKPAGIPVEVYKPLLHQVDDVTGKAKSKRQIAPLILDAVDNRGDCSTAVRSMIEIAAHWSRFHLAADEYAARATVQKARTVLGQIESSESRERVKLDTLRKEEQARSERERAERVRKEMALLTLMFDDLQKADDHQARGYRLQDLLNRAFDANGIPVLKSFSRNSGGEQIDGAFRLEGLHYIVECRWRQNPSDIRELDGLLGQLQRSGNQTAGLFLSIEGWSSNVPSLLKQNREKAIILMDGYDFRSAISGTVDLAAFILAKLAWLNLHAEPHLGAQQYING
jgi:hypothetical protein